MTGCTTVYKKTKNLLTDAAPAAVFALLLLQPILDIISYWASEFNFTAVTTLARFAMFAAVMLYAFIISDRKRVYIIFAAVLGAYWIAHMIACIKSAGGYVSPVTDMNNFLRTVHMPLFALAFITCFRKSDKVPKYVQLAFVGNMIIMMHSVILSYMTGTQIYTYGASGAGLMGWASVHNSQSAILAFAVPLILLYVYRMKKPAAFYFAALVCLVNLFFVGTKVDYFAIPIIVFTMLFFLIVTKEKHPAYYAALGAIVLVCLACYGTSLVNSNVDKHYTSMETKQQYVNTLVEDGLVDTGNKLPSHIDKETFDSLDTRTKHDIVSIYELYAGPMVQRFGFERVFEKYNYSLVVSEITAGRQQKRNFAQMVWEDSDTLTKCFGYEYISLIMDYKTTDPDGNETVQQAIFDLENDFPSVFYYSGYIGFALYLAFIGYFALLIIVGLITRFNKLFTVESGMVGVTFLLALGTSQFSGNVLRRPNASIYLSVILAYIYWLTAIRENVRLRDIFNIFSKSKREKFRQNSVKAQ